MNAPQLADALRLMGQANRHMRIGYNLADREHDRRHPLSEAHRRVANRLHRASTDALGEAMADGLMLYERDDRRTPEDWRREGERAARCFEIGLVFAESLEERAHVRRLADAARRERLEESTRVTIVEPIPGLRSVSDASWSWAGVN